MTNKSLFTLIAVGFLALVTLIIGLSAYVSVDDGERVVITRLGTVDRVLEGGFNWVNPFLEDTHTFSIRKQTYSVNAGAASSDLQNVSTEVTVNFILNPTAISDLYKQLNDTYESVVLVPSVQEAVKSATAKYTAEQLITKREIVKGEIKTALEENVINKAGVLIVVEDISITDFKFSVGFDQAIEAKVQAEQDALTAKNKLAQVQYEAAQKIATAEAEARSIRLQSDAANNEKYVSLKALEVQLEFAKHWNGQYPSTYIVNGEGSNGPIQVIPLPAVR